MTVCLVITLHKIPYIHRIYMVLANPTRVCMQIVTKGVYVCVWMCVYLCKCVCVSARTMSTLSGQNRIYPPYMTVCLVITLHKIPYIHRIYMVLANPTRVCMQIVTKGVYVCVWMCVCLCV